VTVEAVFIAVGRIFGDGQRDIFSILGVKGSSR
jgi:hypothetical protein